MHDQPSLTTAGTLIMAETGLADGHQDGCGRAESPHPVVTAGVWQRSEKSEFMLAPFHAVDSRCCHTLESVEGLVGKLGADVME